MEQLAQGIYGASGSGGFVPARVSASHYFHAAVW
jgi:hypothetical protein